MNRRPVSGRMRGKMRLSQLFTGDRRIEDNARSARPSPSAVANINKQIRSLVPGQTIHGEIVARNGSEVHIKLADDVVLQAKVDQNMNLEVGKTMTFEVRNNGSALTLSPLFQNVSADVNVLKALDMAGIPVTETSAAMTSQMMEAGLPVDRNSLQQMFREINAFPQAQVEDIVNLHRLGMQVTRENVEQMISYRNLTHQLSEGMETVLGALPEAMDGMLAEGNLSGLSNLYQEIFQFVQEGQGTVPSADEGIVPSADEGAAQAQALSENGETAASVSDTAVAAGAVVSEEGEIQQGAAVSQGQMPEVTSHLGSTPEPAAEILLEETDAAGMAPEAALQETDGGLLAQGRTALSEQLTSALSLLPVSAQEAEVLAMQLQQFGRGELSPEQFFAVAGRMLEAAQTAEGGVQTLHRIFSGADFKTLLTEQFKNLWMMKPEELSQPGKVEELYRRIDRQLKVLSHALESGGQAESTAYRATVSLTQNVDFLNQLNQMYSYVQIPLHLRQGDAHGELYVYANKRNLAENDGKISALLHLDMEHLGPVDVYVTLEQTKVNTKFYVRDDEMLDFLSQHMDILTERLAKRGYDCSFAMTTRGEDKEQTSGIAPVLQQEKGVLLSQYAFDVRT